MRFLHKILFFHFLCFLCFWSVSSEVAADTDPTIDEILKRHAKSVGSQADQKNINNRIAIGKSEFELNLPAWRSEGKALFASDAQNSMLVSSFDLAEYPFEKVGLFRGKVEIPFVTPGSRSPMGNYLLLNDNILSEKLFGGVISTSWRMLNAYSIRERLRFAGRKKIASRETYVISFNARGNTSADSGIELYFDAKDYRHLRTVYHQKMPEKQFYRMGIFGNQEGENINTLVEDFDDFRSVGGLTLPHKYVVKLTLDGRAGTKEFRWTFKFDEYRIGQNFGEDFFNFDKK